MQTLFHLVQQARNARNAQERRALSERVAMLTRSTSCPLTHNKQVLFLAIHDTAKSISAAGEWTDWQPSAVLERLPDTSLWTGLLEFPIDARLEYKLVIDGQWVLDPLNPNKVDNGVGGENSWFGMPRYRETPVPQDPKAPKGTLEQLAWQPKGFHARTISVYQPARKSSRMPVLYFHDGTDYLNRVGVARLFDTLIHQRKIEPLVAVFSPPIDRMAEYLRQRQAYLEQFANDLTVKISERYAVSVHPHSTGSAGASLGGFVSLLLALDYPERFGHVLSQSGAFQVDAQSVLPRLKPLPGKGRFWFDYGTYESSLTEINDRVQTMLKGERRAKFKKQNQGHNWSAWKQRLPEAIQWLKLKSEGDS
ncbi:MAG: hypothetical protein KIT45_08820 [Fimbriimonadia bacterium]|nr:hypothetical protein [Fimbriimonadia bacterium]